MERTLCVWFPDWPLRQPGTPADKPVQAVDANNRVIAVNNEAADEGVTVGMRRREAEAVCPLIETIVADRGHDAARFEPVVKAIESVIPRVEIVHPGLVLVPITGAVRYFGGEEAVVEMVNKELTLVALPGHRLGLAAGPFAAQRAAEMTTAEEPYLLVADDAAFLREMDVSAVGSEELVATFRWLGIGTLGELAELPRAVVASRFGTIGLQAHRYAHGEDRTLLGRDIPPELTVEERCSPPLINLEQVAFLARALANRLMSNPAMEGVTPFCVVVEAEAADGVIRTRTWRSRDPLDEATLADRIRWQLQAWLEGERRSGGEGIDGGLVRLSITPVDLSGDGRQLALHEDAESAAAAQRALMQTQAIVGDDQVLQAVPQGGRDPVERVVWYRWGDEPPEGERDVDAPWPGAIPSPTPSLVPPEPYPLEVEWDVGQPVRVRLGTRWVEVVSWAGPWRKMGRWWLREEPCDRYQIVTSAGAFLCEVRDGMTWMTGVYD
ncbi:MAG: DNA polymerase Y family protein [Acidobacteria bacterium]|nr:DNA polymerase Y family protein [Acidobacteriota bacterium]